MKDSSDPISDVIQRHSRSFSLAVRLLPDHAASDARVVYAWCRRADDAIDEGAEAPHAALARLRAELSDVYSPAPSSDELLQRFGEVVRRHRIPEEYPRELLAGMEMDVLGRCYAGLDELLLYCHRVASTVGLMMCHVLGARHPAALRHAAHLGIAMQLTNICRDVREDWERGRVYVPSELLARHRASELRAQAPTPSSFPESAVDGCRVALRELLDVAERYYASADEGLYYLPWRAALAVDVARRVYSAIGFELARSGHDVTAARAVVPAARKVRLVLAALARAWTARRKDSPTPLRLPLRTVHYGPDLRLL